MYFIDLKIHQLTLIGTFQKLRICPYHPMAYLNDSKIEVSFECLENDTQFVWNLVEEIRAFAHPRDDFNAHFESL